ncbi:spore coat protein [Paenibacillus hamazuiensis]|uniref:spore coat protein n=1 Tax=Paenibacillus hamazuiensis TaxID=2936508 RepID=UPI00200EBCB5|nr:spore coat protein [Paenibacillus hamazuiensis]
MNTLLENMTGMGSMTDQVIANDLLIAAKTGIKDCAVALTEATTPEVRQILKKQLDQAISSHEKISAYMIQKGLYHPTQVKQQIQLDLQNAQTATGLA